MTYVQETPPRVTVITLRAPQTSSNKKVAWTEDTVDNEGMNKKKSKCCCIYEKPHKFGESSSSESDDECEHCFGHVERRKKRAQGSAAATTSTDGVQTQNQVEKNVANTTILFIKGTGNDKALYLTVERPKVVYYNEKVIKHLTISAQRHGRRSVLHYAEIHLETKQTLGNNATMDIYFYEFLSNEYRRSFVEMHWKFCDFIHKDKFIGVGFNQGGFARPCPYPAGVYDLYNMTINSAFVRESFPMRKGRIYGNVSLVGEIIISAYFDMEIRESRANDKEG